MPRGKQKAPLTGQTTRQRVDRFHQRLRTLSVLERLYRKEGWGVEKDGWTIQTLYTDAEAKAVASLKAQESRLLKDAGTLNRRLVQRFAAMATNMDLSEDERVQAIRTVEELERVSRLVMKSY